MKMKAPEISVVRFDEEDILTASGDTTRWSLGSWRALVNSYQVGDASSVKKAVTNCFLYAPIKNGNYNYLDDIGSSAGSGTILISDKFYHFDLDSFVDVDSYTGANIYWNWKTCTDESHHYLAESGQ